MTRFVVDAQAAVDLAAHRALIPGDHELLAPTLMRSEVLTLVYASVRRGDLRERDGRGLLDDVRALKIRYLGDRALQDRAWRIAATLDWPDTQRAEYIALTQLQAGALATADTELAVAASGFVDTVPPATILLP